MATKMLMTVRGTVACEADSVRWVLPHEHLFHNINAHQASVADAGNSLSTTGVNGEGFHDTSIRPDQLQNLRVDPGFLNGRNLVLDREDEIFREVEALNVAVPGLGIIVDVTSKREGRDLAKLRRLADRHTGLHIIASASFDESDLATWPVGMAFQEKSERVAKSIETELLFGVGESQSEGCAGIIYQQVHLNQDGKSETEEIITKGLAMVLWAYMLEGIATDVATKQQQQTHVYLQAQINTSAPMLLSFSHDLAKQWPSEEARWRRISEWIDSLVAHGAAPDCIVLCHADLWSETSEGWTFLVELARGKGITLSFDLVGLYTVSDAVLVNPCLNAIDYDWEPPRDSTISRCVAALIRDHGLGDRIVVSSGVQQRIQLERYGGGGYAYALRHFHARLVRQHRLTVQEYEQITRHNAMRLLLWYSPPEAAPIPKHFLLCTICTKYFEPIVGEYFTKFQFIYCGTKCLRKHSKAGFKPL